jgi:TrmH family RNA methyltransferase
MVSKSFEKYVNSLKHKKYRTEHHRFIAEGEKTVQEFLSEGFAIEKILALPAWTTRHERWKKKYAVEEVSPQQMQKLSSLITPATVMMIGEIPQHILSSPKILAQISLVLDGISDPGNLGTIIRIADWFGIEYVFCSENCADAYNPKTVQASMGSLARVKVIEMKPEELFSQFTNTPVFAAALKGTSVYELKPPSSCFLLIGSEAHGISPALNFFVKEHITIPRIGRAESLNAAVAAGIICSILVKP